jgi:hypothetical protein
LGGFAENNPNFLFAIRLEKMRKLAKRSDFHDADKGGFSGFQKSFLRTSAKICVPI